MAQSGSGCAGQAVGASGGCSGPLVTSMASSGARWRLMPAAALPPCLAQQWEAALGPFTRGGHMVRLSLSLSSLTYCDTFQSRQFSENGMIFFLSLPG